MNETNAIVDLVIATHDNTAGIDRTTIILAIIQSVTLVLTTIIALITRIIWKDVNSDRTARINEVRALSEKLTVVEKLNTFLETKASFNEVTKPKETQ